MFCTHLHLRSALIRTRRRRATGNLEINQCCSGFQEALHSKRTTHGTLEGKLEARDDSEYRDFESTLYILLLKKQDGRSLTELMKPKIGRSDGLL